MKIIPAFMARALAVEMTSSMSINLSASFWVKILKASLTVTFLRLLFLGNIPENATAEKFRYDGGLLFHGAGCSLCHSIGNRGGEVGPALTYIGRKRKTEELERLLRDPEEVLPGGKMPQLYLNDEQIKTLAAYLSTLQ